jgi:hypothetical protein
MFVSFVKMVLQTYHKGVDECDDEGLHDGRAVGRQLDSKHLEAFGPDILTVAKLAIDAWRAWSLANISSSLSIIRDF